MRFSKYTEARVTLPACIFYGVDGTLTLLLPALHICLCGKCGLKKLCLDLMVLTTLFLLFVKKTKNKNI